MLCSPDDEWAAGHFLFTWEEQEETMKEEIVKEEIGKEEIGKEVFEKSARL